MPRRAKVAPATRRTWLELYNRGQRLDSIAARDGYSVRTVKRHLEVARRERDEEKVRVNLLSEAYRLHFEDLLKFAGELARRAENANSQRLWPGPDRRARLLMQALKEHIPDSALWQAWSQWDEWAPRMDRLRKEMRERVAESAKVWAREKLPKANVDNVSDSLWWAVQESAKGGNVFAIKYETRPRREGSSRYWGTFRLVDEVSGEEEEKEIEAKHRELVRRVAGPESDLVKRWGEALSGWQEARDTIQEQVEILSFRRMLPGSCFLCPGDVGKGGRGSRRRRRAYEQ